MSVEQLLLWRALKRGWPATGADLQARLEGLALASLLRRHGSGLAGKLRRDLGREVFRNLFLQPDAAGAAFAGEAKDGNADGLPAAEPLP
jgi:hypothetical protein